jgi:hypothetical protein
MSVTAHGKFGNTNGALMDSTSKKIEELSAKTMMESFFLQPPGRLNVPAKPSTLKLKRWLRLFVMTREDEYGHWAKIICDGQPNTNMTKNN